MQKTHEVVNQEFRLLRTETEEKEATSKHARAERDRRKVERKLYQELSRFYSRPKGLWTRPKLLSKRKRFKHTGDISLTHLISGGRVEKPP